jgi:hypothetical protein
MQQVGGEHTSGVTFTVGGLGVGCGFVAGGGAVGVTCIGVACRTGATWGAGVLGTLGGKKLTGAKGEGVGVARVGAGVGGERSEGAGEIGVGAGGLPGLGVMHISQCSDLA